MKALVICDNLHPFDGPNGENNWWLDAVLNSDISSYDHIETSLLSPRTKVGNYDVIIIPSDQTTQAYNNISDFSSHLEDYIEDGGVLSYGVAGYGWQGGTPPALVEIGNNSIKVTKDFQYDCVIHANTTLSNFTAVRSLNANIANHVYLSENTYDQSSDREVLSSTLNNLPTTIRYEVGKGDLIVTGLTLESPNNNSQHWRPFYSEYLEYLESLAQENIFNSTPEPTPTPVTVQIPTPEPTPDPELSPEPEPTPNKDKDSYQNIKGKSKTNVFSELFDVINIFDDLADLDDSLSGTFKLTRKTNKKGAATVKATFIFKDEILQKLDSKKVRFKDKSSNSLFGDFGDVDQIGNPRTVKSGNKKFDYLYNGEDSDTLSKGEIAESSKKLVELSIVPGFISNFESQKVKVKGNFRVNLEDNFIALATGKKEQFADNLMLRADFEPAFDLLDPTFELLA